jgi:hypothetical protein
MAACLGGQKAMVAEWSRPACADCLVGGLMAVSRLGDYAAFFNDISE